MKASLRAKVLLISIGILFGTLTATSLVSGIIFSTEHAAALRTSAFAIGHNLKLQLDRLLKLHIPLEGLVGFDEQCHEIVEGHPDISFASVIDQDGRIIFHSDSRQHGLVVEDPRLIRGIRSSQESSGTYVIGEKESYGFFIPVTTDGSKTSAAAIYIGFPPDLISKKTQRMIGYSAAAAVLFFVIGIALLMLMVNLWVTQPLKRLMGAIEDIQETGVHSMQEVEIRSNDEIGQLGSTFNRMIISLKDFHRKLGEYADQLEVKVRQRTGELEQANQKLRTELTERRKMEEDLMQLGAAVEQAGEAVIITALDGDILYANSAFERITGLNGREVEAGEYSLRFFFNDEITYPAILEAAARGEGWSDQVFTRTRDGRELHAHLTVSPIRNDSGKINNFVAIAMDVTREVLIEKQLRQAQKMESIGTLAGGIAHDFNNLLSIILGNADLAVMDLGNHPASGCLEEIKKASRRATELVRQILAFSRKQLIQPQVIDLNELVQDIRKMIGRLIGENIDLVTSLAPKLRPVKIDPGQVEQVILNLSVNARDAMSDGGRISIETVDVYLDEGFRLKHFEVEPGSYVLLTVSDTGCGMDEETQSHIFEPFFTSKEQGKGTGLGLATVYGIVKQNNGYIHVYSEPGHGSTFKIYLPCCEEPVERSPKEREGFTKHSGGSETILVVEDEQMLRDITSRILTQNGYRVLEAKNGEDALQVSTTYQGPIHLVLTDVIMPGMNVREMAHRLQDMRKDVKMLYVSGYTEEAVANYGVLEEGIEFLSKPVTPSEIISKIRRVLDSALIGGAENQIRAE